MKIETNEIEYCKMQVHYEADPELIESKRSEVLLTFKNANVPGNRKGRASLDAIRIYYYSQIENALKQAMAEQAYHDAVFQEGIQPFGVPDFSTVDLKRNKFSCSFTLNHKPKFSLAPYKDLEIPKQYIKFNAAEEVEKMLESLRTRFGESVPYTEDDFVQAGDIVIIDYTAFDGEIKLDAVSGEGQIITVNNSGVPGLDDNLLGMKLGDTRDCIVKAPETSLPSLAGKDLKFVITLVMGSKVHPMPLNDELAQKAGKATFEELRTFVTGLAEAKQRETGRDANVQQIMARLLADNEVKVPQFLVLSEAKYLAAQSQAKWDELSEADREELLKMGEKNVKTSLILDAIRNEEPEAQLSDQEILQIIEQNVAKTREQKDVESFMMELNKTGQLPILASRLRDEATLDFLIKATKFIE